VAEESNRHQRIMVPVGGNDIDSETVRVAVWLAKQSSSKLYAIHIIEVNRSLPLGAVIDKDIERGEGILDSVDQLAAESAQEVETELVQARETGPAIVDEAEEWGADLIVM